MFNWLGDIISGMGDAMSSALRNAGLELSNTIFSALLLWFYEQIYGAVADFFRSMGEMGAEIFDLSWVQATVKLFGMFGWALYAVGVVAAVFDLAIEYQNGRNTLKGTALNILKGFFACSLISTVPVELYRFCVSLQDIFAHDLAGIGAASLAEQSGAVLAEQFKLESGAVTGSLLHLALLIAFAYCTIKVFFQNIKRGGILLVQIAVGSLYMFSVPRGYADGFSQWVRQVLAICLTAFLQTTLLYMGLMTMQSHMLLGLGIMLSANEVPRIAQQFGLDSSVRVNMMSVVHTTSTAVNLARGMLAR